ncbi:MAG TPA: IscS subfamily cysteine desulfurase [Hydrogenophaga sp.]|uniref:IscS subfamily cysteine desulfurase n=1 Tax=Hydrogenophaga sp. TaxID=1904254 RepID=UPI0008D09010|nr:IscS subfamily cysteine desulfurase [Hydrogenophaga sp.]OGA76426.1 MAG: IscS subfamily cysteine desulfurase [Burkholderiales bacterium GWE1_65_30]OGA91343.1 MAG: IscS subfamily cysteine desulfurase [Burkholderiales bacterium GWF1_66_17]OGB26391.1 MAG: IscS subfamily cysteine desulfurase [Burkholderiales bacterium RIFCSPHIGHO2_02_FULL_66_10]OGB36237.1 MAG: IscS subfamily cysteine desulfurase [Burkholderiales bacterium RIFCSPLOWO2_02_FULL_66_35]HAX19940.1 IscS subfamily cysteine desulfurase [
MSLSSRDPAPARAAASVYLDYAATTPVDRRVANKMIPYLTELYGNPASRSHAFGWAADEAVELAREQVCSLINADPREIVWTSGATESNNLAIKGAAHFNRAKGKHLITLATEHKAVLDSMRELEREGYEVTVLPVLPSGLLDIAVFEAALRPDTVLASVMMVNNETGVIQDIAAIGALCRAKGVVFHVDAAQAAGKVVIDLDVLPVDLLSLSAHKIYGPKGIGALYVRRKPRVRIDAQMHGGGHERGMRSGTLATHQIVGMGEAFWLARENMAADNARIKTLRDRLWAGFQQMDCVVLNGDESQRAVQYLNCSFNYVEGESLLMGIKGVAVSSGSACTSASLEPSYVLRAMGRSDELAHSSVRFSIGRFTTVEEIDFTIAQVTEVVNRLRAMSPLWDMVQAGIDLSTIQWSEH